MKNKTAIMLVNGVTMIRVIGTLIMPFICWYMPPGGLIIYIMCLLLTDTLDGILARRLKACTIFGSLLDQGADKLLGIATLSVLSQEYWVMILPIFTETIIIIITIRGAIRGGSAESSILGKIKTFVLGIAVVGGFCTVFASEIMLMLDSSTKMGLQLIDYFTDILNNNTMIMNSLAFISVGAGIMVASDYALRARTEAKIAKEAGLKIEDIKLKKGKDLTYALFSEEYYQKTKSEPLIQKIGIIKVNKKMKGAKNEPQKN